MAGYENLGDEGAQEVKSIVDESMNEVKTGLQKLQEMVSTQQNTMRKQEITTVVDSIIESNPSLAEKRAEILEKASSDDVASLDPRTAVSSVAFDYIQAANADNNAASTNTPSGGGNAPDNLPDGGANANIPDVSQMKDADVRVLAEQVKAGTWTPDKK